MRSDVKPVEKSLPRQVKKDHKENLQVYRATKSGEFRNAQMGEFGYTECSVVNREEEIEASEVPMFILVSWMDAGTAEGAIQRLNNFSNEQKVLFMSTSHGGWSHASTFLVGDSTRYPNPTYAEQCNMQLEFFDHHLKEKDNGVEDWPKVRYYNMGEEKYHQSDQWPLKNTEITNFYFHKDGLLSVDEPLDTTGKDDYKVDFGVTTGERNRWTTQMGDPILGLHQRQDMDTRMLTYTSRPMKEDLQIAGTPEITIQLSSTHEDGAVLVYLEVVDEQGNSRYITEGGLRLIHRKMSTDTAYNIHSFNEADAEPLVPGQVATVKFKQWPTSVTIKKGQSLRIAIAGADKDTFDKLPKHGEPTISIFRNATINSFISLPIIKR